MATAMLLRASDCTKRDLRHQVSAEFMQHISCQKPMGDLTMQMNHSVTEDQAVWLRMLESHQYKGDPENFEIPDDVVDALIRMGFVRRWRDGSVTITLGGIREVAQH